MSLTNAQYNSIMKAMSRPETATVTWQSSAAHTKLPEYGRLDESVGELSVAQAKLLLNGDDEALTRLRSSLRKSPVRKENCSSPPDTQQTIWNPSTTAPIAKIQVILTVKMVFAKNVIVFISRNWIFSMNSLISGI